MKGTWKLLLKILQKYIEMFSVQDRCFSYQKHMHLVLQLKIMWTSLRGSWSQSHDNIIETVVRLGPILHPL